MAKGMAKGKNMKTSDWEWVNFYWHNVPYPIQDDSFYFAWIKGNNETDIQEMVLHENDL